MIDLTQNPFVSGGLVLMVVGGLLATLRTVPGKLWRWGQRTLFYQIRVEDTAASYYWMDEWITEQIKGKQARHVRLVDRSGRASDDLPSDEETQATTVPDEGEYVFRFQGKLIWLTKSRERQERGSKPFTRSMTFRIFRARREVMEALITEAWTAHQKQTQNKVIVMQSGRDHWFQQVVKDRRPMDSLVYNRDLGHEILEDIRSFLARREWYQQHSVPYRRGYLLYGPPGNGKSSLIFSICSELNYRVCVMNLTRGGLDDQGLLDSMASLPPRSVVCLEDIDAIVQKREVKRKDTLSTLTFTGVLNALDGLATPDGRILFMTTNHREKLDSALIRPGRVDQQYEIGNANTEQARAYFLRFFPGRELEAVQFAAWAGSGRYSMAQLQEHLVLYATDIEAAVRAMLSVA
jgi:chaperone BCS1